MTDPIADMLNRIKNAYAVKSKTVDIVFSQMAQRIAKVLEQKGFIKGVETRGKRARKTLEIALKYKEGMPDGSPRFAGETGKAGLPAISGIQRISKPGQRIYAGAGELKKVRGEMGIAIVSTSKGLMTDAQARKEGIGGEIICEIW